MKYLKSCLSLTAFAALLLVTSLVPGCGSTAESNAAEDEGLIVVRRDEAGDPKSMDPHKAGDVVSSRHCGMTYECLFQYDYLGRPAKLIPALAAETPTYDADELSYTVKLRKDIFFQDDRCFHEDARGKSYRDSDEGEGEQDNKGKGRNLVAEDIAYSFKRLAALPDSGGFWVIEGQIKGLDEFRNEALKLSKEGPPEDPDKLWREHLNNTKVAGLKVIDDYTIKLSLNQQYPQFLYAITLSYGAAVAREAAEYYGDDLFRKPVGTGPFVLKSWRANWEVVWERNPNFREEYFPTSTKPEHAVYKDLMGKRLPIADRVDFRIIKESQAGFLNFLAGNIDTSGLDKDQFASAITAQRELTPTMIEKGIHLQKYEEPTIHYLSFNMNDTTVGVPAGEKGRAIRKALALCINREDYIDRYQNGRGSPARQLVPPSVFGYQKDNTLQSQRFDPEAGRKLLQEAGFEVKPKGTKYEAVDPTTGDVLTLTISFRSQQETTKQYANFLSSQAEQVGITLQSELLTFNEFLKRQNDGKGQAYDAGWVMDYPDAQNMMQLLYGPNKPPGINSAGYQSEEYDKLYEEMSVLDDNAPEDRDRKSALIRQMHDVLERDVPWVLLEFRVIYALYHDWYLPAMDPNPFAYTYLKFAYSKSEQRSEKAQEWTNSPFWPGFLLFIVVLVPVCLMGYKVSQQR
ncbi:MAG: ABC transporter substrate-binding protein [Planctomycetota bacterium]